MSQRQTLTPKQAADVLGLSVAYLYKAMARGELATLKFGARRLIHQNDLNVFIAANRETVHARAARPVDEVNRRGSPRRYKHAAHTTKACVPRSASAIKAGQARHPDSGSSGASQHFPRAPVQANRARAIEDR